MAKKRTTAEILRQLLENIKQGALQRSLWIAAATFGAAVGLALLEQAKSFEFVRDPFDVLRLTLEGIGASFLTFNLVERRIRDADRIQQSEFASNIFSVIYGKPVGTHLASAIDRDVISRKLEVLKAECEIDVVTVSDANNKDTGHEVTLTVTETIEPWEIFEGKSQSIEAYSGDQYPWKLDSFVCRILDSKLPDVVYQSAAVDKDITKQNCSLERDDKTGKVELRYRFRAPKSEHVMRKRVWKKIFPLGIMSNHVFMDGASWVDVKVNVPKEMKREKQNDYPIRVWFGVERDSEPGVAEASDARKIAYRYRTDHVFLPNQGFSFFLAH